MSAADGIAQTLTALGGIQAQGAQNLAAIEGQRVTNLAQIHAQSAQASAQLWGRLADTVASTLNAYGPEAQAKKKQAEQQTTLQGLQVKSLQDTEQEKARGLAEVDTVKSLIQQHQGNIDDAAPEILAQAPMFGQKYLDGVADLRKKFADGLLSQHKLEAEQLQSLAGQLPGVVDDASLQTWVQNVAKVSPELAKSLEGQPYSPDLVKKLQTVGMDAKQQIDFRNASVEAFTKDLQQKKSQVDLAQSANQALGSTLALTPPEKWDEALAAAAIVTPPDVIAKYRALQGQPDAAKQSGQMALTAEQRSQAANRTADNIRQDTRDTETVRHNKAMENRPVGGAAAQGAGKLTDDAVTDTATKYRILGTGAIPTRIDGAERVKIMNEAAKQTRALGQTAAQGLQKAAAFKSDQAALTQMQRLSSAAEASETKAIAQADLIGDLSKKVSRSQYPVFNDWLLSGKKKVLGDTNTSLLFNALDTFTTEYGKIMSGSTGSVAGASDSATRKAEGLISASLNKGTLQATLDQMKWEMAQTKKGYDLTIDHINDRLGGAGSTTPVVPPAGRGAAPNDPLGILGGR